MGTNALISSHDVGMTRSECGAGCQYPHGSLNRMRFFSALFASNSAAFAACVPLFCANWPARWLVVRPCSAYAKYVVRHILRGLPLHLRIGAAATDGRTRSRVLGRYSPVTPFG